MKNAEDEVRKFYWKTLHNHKYFEEWIAAHAGYGSPPSTYIILGEICKFIE